MSDRSDILVECVDAERAYGTGARLQVAMCGATCTLRRGDQIAVTGSSGSGKSTLLHLLAGLDRPTRGTVEWPAFGQPPVQIPGALGIIFQSPSLLPPLDVTENASLPLILSGHTVDEARRLATDALHSVGLAGLGDRLPEELSGGQAQRVALARVLAARPRLILADEPTGQLDAATADLVMGLLIEHARAQSSTLVVSTHDPLVAARLPVQWAMVNGRLDTAGAFA